MTNKFEVGELLEFEVGGQILCHYLVLDNKNKDYYTLLMLENGKTERVTTFSANHYYRKVPHA
jgi:hypothetical protein